MTPADLMMPERLVLLRKKGCKSQRDQIVGVHFKMNFSLGPPFVDRDRCLSNAVDEFVGVFQHAVPKCPNGNIDIVDMYIADVALIQ